MVAPGRCAGHRLLAGVGLRPLVAWVVEAFGGYGETMTDQDEIRPALERAFSSGVPACVNVITDPTVRYGHSGAATF